MEKLNRIVSNREWYHTSEPLKVFEGRLKDMISLLTSVSSTKYKDDSELIEARKQYLVMLVSCHETYLREIFKIIINEKLIPISDIIKIKKLRDVKFSIEELEYIKNKNINLSELVTEYINFQNFEEIYGILSQWNFDKKLNEKLKNKDNVMPLPDSIFNNHKPGDFIIEFFKQITNHKKLMEVDYLIKKVILLLEIRHKIIHRNINISITQEDILDLTIAVYEFIMAVDEFVQDLKNKAIPS